MNLHELFHSRAIMHRQVYTHKCVWLGGRNVPSAAGGGPLLGPCQLMLSTHQHHSPATHLDPARKAKAIELMVVDALLESDAALKLSDRIWDPAEFSLMDDSILDVSGELRWGAGCPDAGSACLAHASRPSVFHPTLTPYTPAQWVENYRLFGNLFTVEDENICAIKRAQVLCEGFVMGVAHTHPAGTLL